MCLHRCHLLPARLHFPAWLTLRNLHVYSYILQSRHVTMLTMEVTRSCLGRLHENRFSTGSYFFRHRHPCSIMARASATYDLFCFFRLVLCLCSFCHLALHASSTARMFRRHIFCSTQHLCVCICRHRACRICSFKLAVALYYSEGFLSGMLWLGFAEFCKCIREDCRLYAHNCGGFILSQQAFVAWSSA